MANATDNEPDVENNDPPATSVDGVPGTASGPEAEASGDGRIYIDTDLLEEGESLRLEGLPYPVPERLGGGYLIVQPTWASFVQRGRTKWDEWLRRQQPVKELLKARRTTALYGSAQDELVRKVGLLCLTGWRGGPILKIGTKKVDTDLLSAKALRAVVEERYMRRIPISPSTEKERYLNMPWFTMLWEAISLCDEADAGEIARLGKLFELGASEPNIEDD